jgi:hypothetical protein
MNEEEYAELLKLGERARDAERAVSLLAGEIDAFRRKVQRMHESHS